MLGTTHFLHLTYSFRSSCYMVVFRCSGAALVERLALPVSALVSALPLELASALPWALVVACRSWTGVAAAMMMQHFHDPVLGLHSSQGCSLDTEDPQVDS